MRTISTLIMLAILVLAVPTSLQANTASTTPPPRPGIIYIVVKFKSYSSHDQIRMNENTRLSVRWGSYSRSGSYGRGRLSLQFKDGFIVTLRHTKNDAVRIEADSDGTIIRIGQYDSPPPEWNDSRYDKYSW